MGQPTSRWRSRRGAVAPPKSRGALHLSKVDVGVILLVALIAVAGLYYVTVYDKPSPAYFGQTVVVQITPPFENSTLALPTAYYPAIVTVQQGAHVSLLIENIDPNATHGLSIQYFNVDTGPIKPLGNVTLSFVANTVGHYTITEPAADCGGGDCDNNQSPTGSIVVLAP